MKNAIGGIAVIFGLIIAPLSLRATATSNFVISEIMPASIDSASQEYIQISSLSSYPIDITGWRLEYFSATSKDLDTPSRTIKLSGSVAGVGDYILATTGYMTNEANASFSPTLSSTGGHLRLVNNSLQILDTVGWGNASLPEGTAAEAPLKSEILERNKNQKGTYIDTDNNASDFANDTLSLESLNNVSKDSIIISELLPNPASPISDATGEFIELFNTTDQTISLQGYKLLTGSNLNHSYVFKAQQINPSEYKALYSNDTHATLANSGGKVQLQSPDGTVINETLAYPSSPDGQSWAWDGATWIWTATPTPNAQNAIFSPLVVSEGKVTKTKSAKKAAVKKTKTSGKVKGASTTTPKKSMGDADTSPAPMHTPVLASVGSLAVLYGVYEYRQDIANAFRKFRGNRGNRT